MNTKIDGVSRARKWQAVTGLIPREEGYRLAREAVEPALALNPNLAEAHTQMGRIKQQIDSIGLERMLPTGGRLNWSWEILKP